jgi:hypothetical protein
VFHPPPDRGTTLKILSQTLVFINELKEHDRTDATPSSKQKSDRDKIQHATAKSDKIQHATAMLEVNYTIRRTSNGQ